MVLVLKDCTVDDAKGRREGCVPKAHCLGDPQDCVGKYNHARRGPEVATRQTRRDGNRSLMLNTKAIVALAIGIRDRNGRTGEGNGDPLQGGLIRVEGLVAVGVNERIAVEMCGVPVNPGRHRLAGSKADLVSDDPIVVIANECAGFQGVADQDREANRALFATGNLTKYPVHGIALQGARRSITRLECGADWDGIGDAHACGSGWPIVGIGQSVGQ